MRILLSNDDGCTAAGLRCLYEALSGEHELFVVAPDRNRSGASNSLTLRRPLRAEPLKDRFYCVDGTPTDCVHLALTGLMDEEPDMVISGINAGRNLGDDTLYSGTVAAALEGRHLGCASIAVSTTALAPQHYETAARVVCDMVKRLSGHRLPGDMVLNVNVPDVPYAQLKGTVVTRLGHSHPARHAVAAQDTRGRRIWWIGEVGDGEACGPGTDFYAVENGQVSVTPLHADLTRHAALEELKQWVQAR
ncbi:MAG: 5'/3'-nucleotidase SurE [Sinobacteraceae bacterium]|nr:5'/3'-nucleotidase SurE [Nevskiaceae bacterium]